MRRREWLGVLRQRAITITLALAAGTVALPAGAQLREGSRPVLQMPSALIVAPGTDTGLAIEISAVEALPKTAFLRLRGLPTSVRLSEGHAISPGVWAVPLASLATLKLRIPADLAGKSRLAVSLVTVDGLVLAEVETALVIAAAASTLAMPASPPRPPERQVEPKGEPQPKAAPRAVARPALDPQALKQAHAHKARGERALAMGGIAEARGYLERAAEIGLAEAALLLGATFDPHELKRMGAVGVAADPAAARRWYEEARRLGAAEAGPRLARLGAR